MDTEAARKARGAFFTPDRIAGFLTRWAVRSAEDTVLEPSCGEAAFLLAAGRRLRELGADEGCRLFGAELHEPSAEAARALLRDEGFAARIETGDFFTFDPSRRFAAILGNPPYIRYQDFTGEARMRSAEAALAQGVRLSGLASSWAAFVVHSALHLEPQGRMALVLPAELLSVKYAAEVRSFLLRRFASLRLVLFEERVFPGVLEDVVLLLAEGSGGAACFEVFQTRNAESLGTVEAASWIRHRPQESAKWTPALVADTAFGAYEDLAAEACEPLASWGSTFLGAVTGNNRFFCLTAAEVARHGLQREDLVRISPPGSRHLRGVGFSERAWLSETREGARTWLFCPPGEPSAAGWRYIASGDEVATGYKCRNRSPWWRVPLVRRPDLFLTYMDHERPRLVENAAGVQILNSVYGVCLTEERRQIGRELLPLAAINSVTLLGAEVVGRAYGGGLLKLEPREADRLPVPSLALVAERAEQLRAVKPQLATALRGGRVQKAAELVDRILFPSADLDAIRAAREILFRRRQARKKNGRD
ncbi:N-6 DNA methylase [Cereibacter sphaeroides]|uniref:HsdM family class I SAM-dependent methyltransferase n=1 Tax=Cereibacter sphaeroides TaxID=1063 RepID=UPI001F223BD8|nr:N-6 DNA methylase [Cereibacter sphaeroides]MCE6952402.1 N-6 DNA methylase [Cereibacter sphaeroides]